MDCYALFALVLRVPPGKWPRGDRMVKKCAEFLPAITVRKIESQEVVCPRFEVFPDLAIVPLVTLDIGRFIADRACPARAVNPFPHRRRAFDEVLGHAAEPFFRGAHCEDEFRSREFSVEKRVDE